MKLTPITSKIKRTTKGGMVQQPLLNMGAPVKMKMSSPAKQGGKNNKRNRGAASAPKPSVKNTKSEQENLKAEISHLSSAMESYQKRGGEQNASDLGHLNKAKAKLKALQGKNKNMLPQGDGVRLTPSGSKGGNDFRETRFDTPKAKKSYDKAYKDSRNVKEYAGMSKAEYIKEAKRQTASKKSGKGWDAKRSKKEAVKPVKGAGIKGAGTKTVKTKAKATSTPKKEITSKNNSSSFINNKRTADIVKGKVNAKTEPKKEVKKTRAQRLRSRGEKALAEGNKKKALRIRRRYDKQVAKDTKKKGQAAGAIEVKKKTKKQSFNAVTNQSGYDSFKKAGGLSAWSKGEIEVK